MYCHNHKTFEYPHEAESFRAVIFLRALDLDEHVLMVLYFIYS